MSFEDALKIIFDKINDWVNILISMLPNLLIASIVIVLGFYLSKKLKNYTDKNLRKYFPTVTLADLSIRLIYIFSIGVVLYLVLKILNLDGTLSTILGAAGILSLGLAFAFQDIAANFISGIILSFSKPFKVGELITVDQFEGFVMGVKLRETTICTHQGHLVTIPNKQILQSPLINYTRYGKRRADITGGVSYAEDLQKVRKVALETLKNVPNVIEKDTSFFFEELGESSIDFRIRIWVNSDQFGDYLEFINNTIIILKKAFDSNEISMPYPIRTLNFGIKAGEKLSDTRLNLAASNQKK